MEDGLLGLPTLERRKWAKHLSVPLEWRPGGHVYFSICSFLHSQHATHTQYMLGGLAEIQLCGQ